MAIKKTRKRTALAASALGLLGLAPQTASADAVNNDQMDAANKEASSAVSSNAFAQTASDAHNEFSSAASLLNSSSAVNSQVSSSNVGNQSSASIEANVPAENQKADSNSASVNASNAKTEAAKPQAASQSGSVNNVKTNIAKNTTDKQNTVTLNVKDAFKTSKTAIDKKMVMASLVSAKLADQYEAKGAEYTEIYGQTIDPKNLISNFSELPAGTTVTPSNLDAIKTKQGRNVVPVTVTYSDGSTDMANAIVWVTSQGTTALAKKVDLEFNSDTNKSEITVEANDYVNLPIWYKGTATISGNNITKGAKIYLSSISEKYRENIGGTIAMPVTDKDGDELGTLNLSDDWTNTGTAGEDKGSYLIVTSSKKYSGDVNIKFDIADGKVYNTDMQWTNLRDLFLNDPPSYGIQPYDYSGTIVQKRWLHMIGHDDQEYTINRTVPTLEEAPITNSHDAGILQSLPRTVFENLSSVIMCVNSILVYEMN